MFSFIFKLLTKRPHCSTLTNVPPTTMLGSSANAQFTIISNFVKSMLFFPGDSNTLEWLPVWLGNFQKCFLFIWASFRLTGKQNVPVTWDCPPKGLDNILRSFPGPGMHQDKRKVSRCVSSLSIGRVGPCSLNWWFLITGGADGVNNRPFFFFSFWYDLGPILAGCKSHYQLYSCFSTLIYFYV